MTASETESEKNCELSIWSASALVSWCIAAECGLIWVVTNSGSQVDLWLAGTQLGAIFGAAFGASFLAVDQGSNNMHAKKPRVLLGVFMLFIFVIFPVWTWTLPEDISTVYGYWKFSGTILIGLVGVIFVAVIVQRYADGHKSVNKFFQLVDTFDHIPFWKKCMCAGIVGLAGAFVWDALTWEALTWEALTWETLTWEVLTWEVLWEILINLNIIITMILAVVQIITLSGKKHLIKWVKLLINGDSEVKKPTDEPITHEQLLEALNDMTAKLEYMRNEVKHMK